LSKKLSNGLKEKEGAATGDEKRNRRKETKRKERGVKKWRAGKVNGRPTRTERKGSHHENKSGKREERKIISAVHQAPRGRKKLS